MHLAQLALVALLVCTGCSTVDSPEPARATAPMFKGVELYSWIDSTKREWRFALVPGTNRMKTSGEILAGNATIGSVEELERRLALLAPGESVFWQVPNDEGFALPPVAVTKRVIERAARLDVMVTLVGAR